MQPSGLTTGQYFFLRALWIEEGLSQRELSRRVGTTELIAMWDESLDQEMKEQLVFVYSQSDEPAALDKLFEIARTETDPELRENAIFWLGQSDDPRVTQFLEDLINN